MEIEQKMARKTIKSEEKWQYKGYNNIYTVHVIHTIAYHTYQELPFQGDFCSLANITYFTGAILLHLTLHLQFLPDASLLI